MQKIGGRQPQYLKEKKNALRNFSEEGHITMYYTYILSSEKNQVKKYYGFTTNLKKRIEYHNAGKVSSTKSFRPWKITFYAAFTNKESALAFKRYLKTASGKAFANKRLLY